MFSTLITTYGWKIALIIMASYRRSKEDVYVVVQRNLTRKAG